MATTLGGVSSALVAFTGDEAPQSSESLISRKTIDIISCIYAPLSILMMCYALFTYRWRTAFMRQKQVRPCAALLRGPWLGPLRSSRRHAMGCLRRAMPAAGYACMLACLWVAWSFLLSRWRARAG